MISAVAIAHRHGSVSSCALERLLNDHYLRRKPPMADTFEMHEDGDVVGVCTFGVPASRHMQISAYPDRPNMVVELNRLWIADSQRHGMASWFLARCLKDMPPRIVVSYADTSVGHHGGVYRAANFNYAGWTDMDRKTARFDYTVPGMHSREAFRKGGGVDAVKVRRRPKARYWTVTGDRRERRELRRACGWPVMSWADDPVPSEHKQRNKT